MNHGEVDKQRKSLKAEKIGLKKICLKYYNYIKCVHSIVEVNVLAETIWAKVRFLWRIEHSP